MTLSDVLDISFVYRERDRLVINDMFENPSERWLPAKGVSSAIGRLLVSSLGRVVRLPLAKESRDGKTSVIPMSITRGSAQYRGHLEVSWASAGSRTYSAPSGRVYRKRDRKHVHQLVAWTFLGPPPDIEGRLLVRHLNGNPQDNRAINLAWGTDLDNQRDLLTEPGSSDMYRHGLYIGAALHRRIRAAISGEEDPISVLKELESRILRARGRLEE